MQARLIVISGPDRGREFVLAQGQTLVIGRGSSTDTRLTDPRVSRTHCQVRVDKGKFRLADLGSRVGTPVNRTVPLRGLWPETAESAESVQRFVRAMTTMMPLRHPNIVQIYAAGRSRSHCWLAMEYVESENLSQVIIDQICKVQPASPQRYQLSIPDLFEGVVLRMLAKRPGDRFRTATELLVDLERVGKHRGVTV